MLTGTESDESTQAEEQEEAAARVPVHRGGGVGASNGARLGQFCPGDARDAAPRGSQACSWPPMCGTRCVPAAVPRQNPPSAICYRARALAQRWCATPGLSATRRALEAWACLVVPVLTSAVIGAVVTRHNCLLLGRPSLRSIHTSSLVAQVWPVRYRHKRRSHASASCSMAAAVWRRLNQAQGGALDEWLRSATVARSSHSSGKEPATHSAKPSQANQARRRAHTSA